MFRVSPVSIVIHPLMYESRTLSEKSRHRQSFSCYVLIVINCLVILRILRNEVLVPIRYICGDLALVISCRLLKHSFAATRNLSQSALRPNDILREYHAYREWV